MQSSLPAGWLAFTGRELNPLDRYKRFQITFSSPFSGFILAQGKFHFELPTNGSLIPTAGPRYGRHRIGPPIGRGGRSLVAGQFQLELSRWIIAVRPAKASGNMVCSRFGLIWIKDRPDV